jgi:hypothetical protein
MRSADGETDVPLMPHELWHSEATAMFFVIFEVPFSRRARLSATGFGPAAECSPSSEAGTRCFKTNHLRVLKRQGHGTAGRRRDRSRRKSYQPGHPLRRAAEQRCPKFGISRHQSIKRETPIETARIGKNPGHCAGKSHRVLAPLEVWLADHRRQGALSEKGDRARSITPNLGFKPDSSLEEFFR